jgi:hypothetical protein
MSQPLSLPFKYTWTKRLTGTSATGNMEEACPGLLVALRPQA